MRATRQQVACIESHPNKNEAHPLAAASASIEKLTACFIVSHDLLLSILELCPAVWLVNHHGRCEATGAQILCCCKLVND